MSSTPGFFSTPVGGPTIIPASTAYSNGRAAPTGATLIHTASSSAGQHQRIFRITAKSLGTSVANALLDFWRYDGTTYYQLPITRSTGSAGITGSNSLDTWETTIEFPDGVGALYLPVAATPWKLYAGFTVAQTSAVCIDVVAGQQ